MDDDDVSMMNNDDVSMMNNDVCEDVSREMWPRRFNKVVRVLGFCAHTRRYLCRQVQT